MGNDPQLEIFPTETATAEALTLWATVPKNHDIVRPAGHIDATLLESGKQCFVQGWTHDASWWNFGLVYGTVWIGSNLDRVPTIRDFMARLPYRHRIVIAGLSILNPGASIPLHHDEPPEKRGFFRVEHFGLFGDGTLHVNGVRYDMQSGTHVTFDDANDHEAANLSTTSPRAVLYIKCRV